MGKTTVEIDESLLKDAIKAIGAKTKKEAIESLMPLLRSSQVKWGEELPCRSNGVWRRSRVSTRKY